MESPASTPPRSSSRGSSSSGSELQPELLHLATAWAAGPSTCVAVFRDVEGFEKLWVEAYGGLRSDVRLVRDACSTKVLLTCEARGWGQERRRRHWSIYGARNHLLMNVQVRCVGSSKDEDAPRQFVMEACQAHHSRPCIRIAIEDARLVMRTLGGRLDGVPLLEAAYGDGELATPVAAAAAAARGECHAALAPRADVPLMCCLLVLYQAVLDGEAARLDSLAAKRAAKLEALLAKQAAKDARRVARQLAQAAAA